MCMIRSLHKGTDYIFAEISVVKIKIRFLGRAVDIYVSRIENLSLLITVITRVSEGAHDYYKYIKRVLFGF